MLWISESSISTAELMPLEENNWVPTELVEMQNVKGRPWTHMKVGSSPWNREQARVVTEGEITRVPRGLRGSRKVTQSRWLLGEWFSRQADLCYLVGCVLPLNSFEITDAQWVFIHH